MTFLYHAGSNWTPREGGGAHLDRCHCETLTLSPPAPALSSSRPHTVSSAPPVNEKKNKRPLSNLVSQTGANYHETFIPVDLVTLLTLKLAKWLQR